MKESLVIPESLERAIIDFRLSIHRKNEKGIFLTKPLELSEQERKFWAIADHDELVQRNIG